MAQWIRLHAPNAGGWIDPWSVTRSHMPQVRVHALQLKTLHIETKESYIKTKIEDPACLN